MGYVIASFILIAFHLIISCLRSFIHEDKEQMLGVERIHGVEQKALRRLLASIHSFLFQNENEMKESGSQQRSGMSKLMK